MKNEAHDGSIESLEVYKGRLGAWGQEFVNRAIEADLSGEDCEKIERFVAAAVESGANAFNGETLPWTQTIFDRVVEKLAKSSSPEDAALVQKVSSSREATVPIVTPEEAAAIPALHVPRVETDASTEGNMSVSAIDPTNVEHVFHGFDQAKWSNAESSPEETYNKYSENVQRIADERIAKLGDGATPLAQQHIREVIYGLRDRVIDAARSEGPIPFEQRLKYDKSVLALSAQRPSVGAKAPVASVQDSAQHEEKKEPIKSFADLAAMRDALPVIREEQKQEADEAIMHAPDSIHRSATHEPSEVIVGVSTEITREEPILVPEAGGEKAAVERLNTLKSLIDAEHEIIRATREENKRDRASGWKITDARLRLGELHQEAKEIAARLVDPLELFALVKPADETSSKAYESQIPRKTPKEERRKLEATLSEDVVHAYYEAIRRKNAFADMLGRKGVEKDIAYDLYREFTHQAVELDILKDVLERGEENGEDVLSTSRAQKVLEWHGIAAREPQAILAALTPLVGLYHTIPPRVERAVKNVPREKMTPMSFLSELLLSGKEDITLVPRSMLQQLVTSENETIKHMAEEELVRLDAQEAERSQRAASEAAPATLNTERDAALVALLLSGAEDVSRVPRLKLRQLATNENPDMRAMAERELAKIEESLRVAGETAAPEDNASAPLPESSQPRTVAAHAQTPSPVPSRLSGRQMEDLIESTPETPSRRNAPTTAETAFEIKQGKAANKAAIGRGSSTVPPPTVDVVPPVVSREVTETPPESPESLKAKAVLVGDALALFFGKTGQVQGGHLTESGVAQLREALVACNYPQLDEARLHAADAAYLAELEEWLRAQYNEVLLPAVEQIESANVSLPAPTFQFAEEDKMVSIEALLAEEDAATQIPDREKLPPLNHGVVKQFEEKFGITEGMLEDVPGLRELSSGQQLLVLKNLEQMALTDIEKEATAQQKAEWVKLPTWKRIWKQSYSLGMNPEYRTALLQKELLAKYRQSMGAGDAPGRAQILALQLANMEQLVKVAAEGPEVNVTSDGALEMVYLEEGNYQFTSEQKKQIEEFNTAASEFAKFPREWGYDTDRPGMIERWSSDRRRYEVAKERYAKARAAMLQLRTEKFAEEIAADSTRQGEDPEKRAMLGTNLWDERVELNQLFINHPDAEAALQNIEDQNTIFAAAKEFWKSKGMFIAGGALVRGATIAISGGIMLPAIGLIGAGVGGAIGKREGKQLMKARREDGRMSEEDLREEITFTTYEKNPDGSAKLDAEGMKIPSGTGKRRIKEFTDATFFVDRMDRLTEKLFNTDDLNEKSLIIKKLAQTELLMSERFERGMINFGGSSLEGGDERKGDTIANRLSFMQALAKGQISHTVDYEALETEIERITGLRQSTIEDKRKAEIKKIAAKSALIRGAFALAGAGIVESAKQIYHFGEPGFWGATTAKAPNGVAEALPDVARPPVAASEVAPDAANPEAFTAANFDRNIASVIGRAPSAEELSALRLTGGLEGPATANMDQHNALIGMISASPTPLSHEQIEAVLGGSAMTANAGETLSPSLESMMGEQEGAVALAYHVQSGDNLTHIMQHLDVLKGVPLEQQENIIQNFIRSLSDEEKVAIGINDVNNIQVDQTVHLDKLNELLLQKRVGEEWLIAHAQQLGVDTAATDSPAEVAPEVELPSVLEAGSSSSQTGVPTNIAEIAPNQRVSLWGELSDTNKHAYIAEAAPRHITEDIGNLFAKGPFEEWPKEWASLRGRFVDDLLLQTENTDPHTLLPRGMEGVPLGYEWSVVNKIQQYIEEHGLTPAHGITPRPNETLEDFLSRGLSERILRDGPLPWLRS